MLGGRNLTMAASASDIITNASDILALSAEQASRAIPVSIKGAVTAAEPAWAGRFFVQDSSGGVFVNNVNGVQPSVGDLVAVQDHVHLGQCPGGNVLFLAVNGDATWRLSRSLEE